MHKDANNRSSNDDTISLNNMGIPSNGPKYILGIYQYGYQTSRLEFIATGWLIDCPYKPRYLMKSWLYTWWYFCTAACVKGLQITTFMGIRVYVNKWVLYKFRCSLQYICLRGVRCCCGKYGILLDDRWGSPNWTDCSDEAWDLSFFSRVASGNKWKYRWPAKRYFLYRINFYCGKYCKKSTLIKFDY